MFIIVLANLIKGLAGLIFRYNPSSLWDKDLAFFSLMRWGKRAFSIAILLDPF